jgi:hypothetical protein
LASDLAIMGKELEQLKADRQLLIRDNANMTEQIKGIQDN